MEKTINTCMSLGSSLPLVFVGGRPACLGSMTMLQLKRFIPFMLHCEGAGHEIPLVAQESSPKPCWWPLDLEFSMSIYSGDTSPDEVVNKLRDIVRRCYKNYGLCPIIDLSTSMSDPKNTFGFVRVEHSDNGTSNVISSSNKLVVTIRSSVVKYDEEIFNPKANIALRQCPNNRPILKLVKSCYPDSKYAEGRIQLPCSSLNSISKLNPRVVLPGVVFVNSRGHKVQYPFLESSPKNVLMAGQESTRLDGDNVCKVVVLSDNETIDSCVRQRRGSKSSSLSTSAASTLNISSGPKCQHCEKEFSGEDFCQEHEESCSLAPLIPKTELENKLIFISGLDLIPAQKSKKLEPVKAKHQIILNQLNTVTTLAPKGPKRSKRNKPRLSKPKQVSTFFKTHPIPFSSGLGLQLVQKSDTGLFTESTNIDQFCSTSNRVPQVNTQNYVTTLKKKGIQNQDHAHTIAFTSRQRAVRVGEIVTGINKRAWASLNKCKECSVQIKEEDIIPSNLVNPTTTPTNVVNGSHLPGNDQPNQPIEALGRSLFDGEIPVIKIQNIFNDEKYAKYFQKAATTN